MSATDVILTIDGKQNICGTIRKTDFCKIVKSRKQIMQKFNAVGMDAEVWNTIVKQQCETFTVLVKYEKMWYRGRTSELDLIKHYQHHKPYRAQVFFPLEKFKIKKEYKPKKKK